MNSAFTVIDVETANADVASICQIGIVQFDEGAVVEEWQSLVNPEDHFDGFNVALHGITSEMTASAPTLPRLHEAVITRLAGRVVVCHTAFDRVSLRQACFRYNLPSPDLTWLDSARVARRAWPDQCGKRNYGLGKLRTMLSLSSFTAHVAVEDAKAAGWVVLRAMTDTGLTIEDWLKRVERPIVVPSDLSGVAQENPDGPLYGDTIVFTGALSIARGEAAVMAARAGCKVRDTVSRLTTILVVGDQDIRKLGGQARSSKHRKAESLIQGGQAIRVVGESDFRRIAEIG